MSKLIRITETVLRDGQQSQIATRMTTEDMLPILKTGSSRFPCPGSMGRCDLRLLYPLLKRRSMGTSAPNSRSGQKNQVTNALAGSKPARLP